MNVKIVPATDEHIRFVAQHMRASDVAEVAASHDITPLEACQRSVERSAYAYCGMVGDAPVYLFGLALPTAFSGTGIIWGLGTDSLRAYHHHFLRASHNFVSFCRGHVQQLENWVHADNAESIAWLKWLGFEFDEPEPYGAAGELFIHFHMTGGFLSNRLQPNERIPHRQRVEEAKLPPHLYTPEDRRKFIMHLEDVLRVQPNAVHNDNDTAPVTHHFAKDLYVREINIPAGMLLTGAIHRHEHPSFLLDGVVTVVTEEGGLERMSAPQIFISPEGVKRAIFTHTATRWATVHRTEEREPAKLRAAISFPNYSALEQNRQLEAAQ